MLASGWCELAPLAFALSEGRTKRKGGGGAGWGKWVCSPADKGRGGGGLVARGYGSRSSRRMDGPTEYLTVTMPSRRTQKDRAERFVGLLHLSRNLFLGAGWNGGGLWCVRVST